MTPHTLALLLLTLRSWYCFMNVLNTRKPSMQALPINMLVITLHVCVCTPNAARCTKCQSTSDRYQAAATAAAIVRKKHSCCARFLRMASAASVKFGHICMRQLAGWRRPGPHPALTLW